MGQKIPPRAVRLGFIEEWNSKWIASFREFPALIEEDWHIRHYLKEKLKFAAVSHIVIERTGNKFLRVNVYTARPGVVIGKRGADIENLKHDLEGITGRRTMINVFEIKQPELDAQLVAEGIALQLEKRINYRRAMKRAIERSIASGALGIKVAVGGRLGGAEIARSEWLREGRIPLHTFRALIDYGFTEAICTYGKIGVKVWIFKKELFKKSEKDLLEEAKLVEQSRMEELPERREDVSTSQEEGKKENVITKES
ncbi:MAG TPA: 30S ribosomal protein S3 [Elusimicrobia bacterium]|jgi:small subunit ribosomal protein S3|nr:30S ribosomal protein S3 [Elusimicrobiota bacterium]